MEFQGAVWANVNHNRKGWIRQLFLSAYRPRFLHINPPVYMQILRIIGSKSHLLPMWCSWKSVEINRKIRGKVWDLPHNSIEKCDLAIIHMNNRHGWSKMARITPLLNDSEKIVKSSSSSGRFYNTDTLLYSKRVCGCYFADRLLTYFG